MSYNAVHTNNIEIHSAVKLPPSATGIPRWELHTNEGTWTTQTNARINTHLEKLSDADSGDKCVVGKPGRIVTLIHTRSKEVIGLIYRGFHYL